MNGKRGVVGLDNGIGNLRGRNNRECGHHAVREFLANLGDEKCAHAGTRASSKRVCNLETLQAVAAFCFTTNHVQNLIHQLGTLSVVTLGPDVAGARLTKDEVVRTEQLTERPSTDSIHCAGFEIDENSAWDIFVARSLIVLRLAAVRKHRKSATYFIEVNVQALQLQVACALVSVKG